MASFLDNTKNFGLMIAIIGLVDLIVNVIALVDGIDNINLDWIGGIIIGLVYLAAGWMVYSQKPGALDSLFPEGISSKFGVLTGYVFLVGVTAIIGGIFFIIANTDNIGGGVGDIILGLIILIIGWIITNDKKTAVDKIVWVLLVIIFLLLLILAILSIFEVGNMFSGLTMALMYVDVVATIVMYLMAFLYLLNPEVKSKF